MTTLFLMLLPFLLLLSFGNPQIHILFMLLYRRLTKVAYGNVYYNMLPTVAGMAYADGENEDTVESPKDPGPSQPIKQG